MNSVYYNLASNYKRKGYKKRPSYGYGRTSDDYYDDYDYDSKYLDRYDKDEGKYEDKDRDYYRRRRPAGQGRVSDAIKCDKREEYQTSVLQTRR